jgi:ribose transport system substrate-binding protein
MRRLQLGCFVALTLVLAALAGCGSNLGKDKKLKIAVIPKGTTHQFWQSVHYGAQQAADKYGVEIIWSGPPKEDNRTEQIGVVENSVTRGVDGICLAPLDARALVAAVKSAKQEGIPSVIFDSGLDSPESIVSYVATDNANGGALAARELGKLLGGKGNVILFRYAIGSESTEQREQGFLDALAKEFPDIKVISQDQYAGATAEEALTKAQNLLNKLDAQADGIFAVNESCAMGMLQALRDAGLAGKVKFIGFDTSDKMIAALKSGDMHGLVLQDPVKMGFTAVETMVKHLRGEKVVARIATGELLATQANMDEPAVKERLQPPHLK